uniref:60S ribosomal export protein NMD3 n=1 Tax=Octactis speculum TaxID=3111310 RepID=A0A7S2AZN0_9STRA
MCAQCLKSAVDITDGIPTQLSVYRCRGCQKWLKPGWIEADLESGELLALCLKKIRGLNKVKLVDASWVWTEPHSMRLKIKLNIQKEVMNAAVLQQAFVVEYVIRNQQCSDCQKQYTGGVWKAVVQVRQRVDHKRTFYYLEQLLLKHGVHTNCLSIQTFRDGMDFYFAERNQAVRFTDFLQTVVPIRMKNTKKLISSDNHSNLFNYKFTHLGVIAPLCKDDLVVLPKALALTLGNISPLVLIERVSTFIHLVDPFTCQRASFDIEHFYKVGAFGAVLSAARLVEYVVLGTEDLILDERESSTPTPTQKRKKRLVEVELARSADLGVNDTRLTCVSHLGHLLRAGDTVLGYDLERGALHSLDRETMAQVEKRRALPDSALVRKLYGVGSGGDGETTKSRRWKLKELAVQEEERNGGKGAEDVAMKDYEQFMQQLEGDREMRRQVNLFKATDDDQDMDTAVATDDACEMDEQEIRIGELLEDLGLDDETPADPEDMAFLAADAMANAAGSNADLSTYNFL